MNAFESTCCPRRAFELMSAEARRIDTPSGLLAAAVSVAQLVDARTTVSAVDRRIQRLADLVSSRVSGGQAQALLAHLHDVLFEEESLTGNTEDYFAPANSSIARTLDSSQGLPITLALIYKLVAERVGLRAEGVGLPGHFVALAFADGEPILVDCFYGGRILNADEARSRVEEMYGPELEWSSSMLRPVSHRHWITRMLQNLLHTFGRLGQYRDVAAVLELEMLLWPEKPRLQRDLGLVLARAGMSQPAQNWLDTYLKTNPDDPQRQDLEQLMDVLKA